MTNALTSFPQNHISGKTALTISRTLSVYPIAGTSGILLGGLLKSKLIVWLTIATWVLALYAGLFTWLGLIIYLKVKKRISTREILFQVLIAVIGIASAYYVIEYDIFNSGAKYID